MCMYMCAHAHTHTHIHIQVNYPLDYISYDVDLSAVPICMQNDFDDGMCVYVNVYMCVSVCVYV